MILRCVRVTAIRRAGDHLTTRAADSAFAGLARMSIGRSGCAARSPLFSGDCVAPKGRALMIAEDRGIVVQPIKKSTSTLQPPAPPPGPAPQPPTRPPFEVTTPIRVALPVDSASF
jgi:hypothetical protein